MPKIWTVEQKDGVDSADLMFWCPACQFGHGVWTTHPNGITGAKWKFNGNVESPTIEPSVLVQSTVFSAKGKADYDAWYAAGCPDRKGQPFDSIPVRCHSVITNGVIHYCGDCSHAMAGKSVQMEDIDHA